MNLLALETSTESLSIAILRDGVPLARDVDAGQRHSELALPLLNDLLVESTLTLRDIDAIAFGQGPGSFTGVRTAFGRTQGLAFGIGKSLVPVPTQMALAEQAGADEVIVALDARMGEIYFAAYRRDIASATGWQAVVEPMLVKPEALPSLECNRWCATGSGFDVPALSAQLMARYDGQLTKVMNGALPRALDVARIAHRQLNATGMESAIAPQHAAPLYLRNKVAMTIEERREHHAAKSHAVS
jgi:tRNA threonylcarbamoyladenosine biosynthesis protein TsaB